MADHDRRAVDRSGSHFGKAGLQDFQLNGDRTLRFDLSAGRLARETDIISKHAVEGVTLRQQGSLCFVPGIRAFFKHADKEFDFLIESALCHFSPNDDFVQCFRIDGLQRSERSDNDRFINHRSVNGIILRRFGLNRLSRGFHRGRFFCRFLSRGFHRGRFFCRFLSRSFHQGSFL